MFITIIKKTLYVTPCSHAFCMIEDRSFKKMFT